MKKSDWCAVNPITRRIIFTGSQTQCREFLSKTDPSMFLLYNPDCKTGESIDKKSI